MANIEFTNNYSERVAVGDIARTSGENFGATLARADVPDNKIIGVWTTPTFPGYAGSIDDGVVEVNCVEKPVAGQPLYLSPTVAGKATHTKPPFPYFIGICLSDKSTSIGFKAFIQFGKGIYSNNNLLTGDGDPPDPLTVPDGTIYFRYV
jgi:hypothetical protein